MKFRKKPVEIEAVQFTGRPAPGEWPQWLMDAVKAGTVRMQVGTVPCVIIATDTGEHRAEQGDWIAQGTAGEIYPIKAAIFPTIYESIE